MEGIVELSVKIPSSSDSGTQRLTIVELLKPTMLMISGEMVEGQNTGTGM